MLDTGQYKKNIGDKFYSQCYPDTMYGLGKFTKHAMLVSQCVKREYQDNLTEKCTIDSDKTS